MPQRSTRVKPKLKICSLMAWGGGPPPGPPPPARHTPVGVVPRPRRAPHHDFRHRPWSPARIEYACSQHRVSHRELQVSTDHSAELPSATRQVRRDRSLEAVWPKSTGFAREFRVEPASKIHQRIDFVRRKIRNAHARHPASTLSYWLRVANRSGTVP
jgi:hypothetical protein